MKQNIEFSHKLATVNPITPNRKVNLCINEVLAKILALRDYRSQVKLGPAFFWKWGIKDNLLHEFYHIV